MINQFGVTGDKLKNGEFQHYEISLNGVWAGDVYKTYLGVWTDETTGEDLSLDFKWAHYLVKKK